MVSITSKVIWTTTTTTNFSIYVTHDYKLKIVSTQIAQANQGGLKKQELIIVMIVIMKDYKANEIENKGDYYDNTKGRFICNLRV